MISDLDSSLVFTHPDLESPSGFTYVSSTTFTMNGINDPRLFKGWNRCFDLCQHIPKCAFTGKGNFHW